MKDRGPVHFSDTAMKETVKAFLSKKKKNFKIGSTMDNSNNGHSRKMIYVSSPRQREQYS